jgi:tetratricopeptide (TPR) repeat protein
MTKPNEFLEEIEKGLGLAAAGRPEEATQLYDRIAASHDAAGNPTLRTALVGLRLAIVSALGEQIAAMRENGILVQSLDAGDTLNARYGADANPDVRNAVAIIRRRAAQALWLEACAHRARGGVNQSAAMYEDIRRRFGQDRDPDVRSVVTRAIIAASTPDEPVDAFREPDSVPVAAPVEEKAPDPPLPPPGSPLAHPLPSARRARATKLNPELAGFLKWVAVAAAVVWVLYLVNKDEPVPERSTPDRAVPAQESSATAMKPDARVSDAARRTAFRESLKLAGQGRYDEAVARLGNSGTPVTKATGLTIRTLEARALLQQGKTEEAITTCDAAIERFGRNAQPEKADETRRGTTAQASGGDLVSSFIASRRLPDAMLGHNLLYPSIKGALLVKANALEKLGKLGKRAKVMDVIEEYGGEDETLETLSGALSAFEAGKDEKLRAWLSNTLVDRVIPLAEPRFSPYSCPGCLSRAFDERDWVRKTSSAYIDGVPESEVKSAEVALKVFDDVGAIFFPGEGSDERRAAARALIWSALARSKRAAYDNANWRSEKDVVRDYNSQIAVNTRGAYDDKRYRKAIPLLDKVVDQYGADTDSGVRKTVSVAFWYRGLAYAKQGKTDQAEKNWRAILERHPHEQGTEELKQTLDAARKALGETASKAAQAARE